MSDSIPPLDRRWLEVLEDDRPPPEDAEHRVRARLAATVPAMAAPRPPAPPLPIPAAAPSRARPRLRAWHSHLLTFAGGCFLGGAVAASFFRTPARVVVVDRPAAPPVVERPADPPPAPAPAPPHAAPAAVEWPATHGTPPGSAASSSQLAAERRLLDAARTKLGEGEPAQALAKLEQHRARYLHGMLSEERDAMFVLSLVRAGRNEDARARASSFLQHSTDSLFRSAVETAIRSISVTTAAAGANPEDGGDSP